MVKKTKRQKKEKPEQKRTKLSNPEVTPSSAIASKFPIAAIGFKVFLISVFTVLGLYYSETAGYFNINEKGNHTKKKWDAFYELTEDVDIDILLVGNSHLYTGINPKNLSAALGVNAFILGAPGTYVADHYFNLQEALKRSNPKLVIVETYGLSKSNPLEFSGADLSDQIKSFATRKDIRLKLASTPELFALKNYPYAWSTTLRNHDFLYTNFKQIDQNIKMRKGGAKEEKEELYLGRFIRFKTGIEDTTLNKYRSYGAPVDGADFAMNEEASDYTKKIIDLCESKNIKLMFLTLPMFEKHVSNYDQWKKTLGPHLGSYKDGLWLDLQQRPGYDYFTVESFQNTYAKNQHMSYSGSLLATCKLINFLATRNDFGLVDRRNDAEWRKRFYGMEGFFEYHTPNPNDKENLILYQNDSTGVVREILLIKEEDVYTFIAKVSPRSEEQMYTLMNWKIKLTTVVNGKEGKKMIANVEMPFDGGHTCLNKMVFAQYIEPVDFVGAKEFKFIE